MSGLKTINNLLILSDIHAGCKLAICPKDGVPLDDGGRYMPSPMQLKLYAWWEELWNEWVPEATIREPFAVVINGDCMDGVHHESTTQISHNLADQQTVALELLKPIKERAEGRIYMVRGTEAHCGKSGQNEEKLAQALGAIPNEAGQYARWELWKRVGEKGRGGLVHCSHHIGTTGSSAYESTAVHKEMIEAFNESGRWGEEPPRVVVRSHRHRYLQDRVAGRDGEFISLVTPGWQLRTPFAFRIVGGRASQPQIGAVLVRYHRGELFARPFVRSLSRPKEE